CRSAGRPVRPSSGYMNELSQPPISTIQETVSQGWVKKRRTKNRVSTGTLPYQMTRYCDQKKYIHMIDIANCSLATSCTAGGGTVDSPRALARVVMIGRKQV